MNARRRFLGDLRSGINRTVLPARERLAPINVRGRLYPLARSFPGN